MDEISEITGKYDAEYIERKFVETDDLNQFALTFFKDVAEIYDILTRVRNIERDPEGFSILDAPILGLLVRVWKLLKEVIKYYEAGNAEIISILERPLLEAAVTATFLLNSPDEVLEDYRKCSYKDRLRILRDLEDGSKFFETNAGKRLLASVREKLAIEGWERADFEQQKNNRWRVQGKTFFQIFSEVEHADLYRSTYGMMSESIHGSWNESMDWCLTRSEDGTYLPNPFSYPADIRFVAPILGFTVRPYQLWLERIEVDAENVIEHLAWVQRVNTALFRKFDVLYKGK